jgi:hypothetical protein
MRFWLCLVLAACGADSVSTPAPSPPSVPTPAPPRPSPPPRSAPHGSEIVALGVTADGGAVATTDRLGGIRLWTTLDGTREPVVIQGTAARSIALWRDGDGFALATLDAAGGVHVVQTTTAGAVRGRATVTGGPITEMASTPEGLLILRADQALELVDAGGVLRSRLTPEPGTRIDSLVARSGRVLALVQEDKQLRGRWVVVHHGAHWGDATPRLPFKIGHAVLSPAGDLLAVSRPRSLHPALIDLTNGTARKVPLCVTKQWPHEDGEDRDEGELLRSDNAPLPLGFLTANLVACAVMGQLTWWDVDGSQHTSGAGSFPITRLPIAMTDRALVTSAGTNLALASPELNQFLGYGVHDLSGLRITPGVVTVSGPDQQSMVLDDGLRERARFELGRSRSGWLDFVPIDERYGVAVAVRRSLDRRTSSFQLAVFDGVAQAVHQMLPYQARDKNVAYAPETHLLATSDNAMAMLLRFDPASHTFGSPLRVGTAIAPSKLVVLDPRLSLGVAALAIDQVSDGLLVGELRDDELRPGATIQARTTYRVPGELRAVDRAGHLYVHRKDDHDDVVVFARDLAVARLPGVADMALHPNADGSRIAAFQSPRLVMLSSSGEVRWDSAQWSGSELDWTAAGDLIVEFPTGVARIDLDTGELADRRCGWRFGLSEQALETRHHGPSICDVER